MTPHRNSPLFTPPSCGMRSAQASILRTLTCIGLLCGGSGVCAQQDSLPLLFRSMTTEEDGRLMVEAQELAASIKLESSWECAENNLTRAMRRDIDTEFTLIDPLHTYPSRLLAWLPNPSRREEPVDKAVILRGMMWGSEDQWAENSLVFSLDTTHLRLDIDFGWSPAKSRDAPFDMEAQLASRQERKQLTTSWLSTHFKDFYFKNEEVTNREYREFTDWVKDSIVRSCIQSSLPERAFLKNEPVPFQDKAVQQVLLDHGLIFDLPDSTSLDWNHQALTCLIDGQTICIYPDTLCWVRRYFGGNSMLSNTYFRHPAYDDYPVVGVTWLQTQAFLHWKENQMNAAWRNSGIEAKVTLRLPEYHEWILAHSEDPHHFGAVDQYKAHAASARSIRMFLDFDLIQFDSNLEAHGNEPLTRDSPVQELLHGHERLLGDYLVDGSLYTQSVHSPSWSEFALGQVEGHTSGQGLLGKQKRAKSGSVRHQSGNVSEWLCNDMAAWNSHCSRFQSELDRCASEECEILRALFQHQQQHLEGVTDGKLVVGANWFDERMGMSPGGILPGALAKNFMEATTASASLGFRYVMHISPNPTEPLNP